MAAAGLDSGPKVSWLAAVSQSIHKILRSAATMPDVVWRASVAQFLFYCGWASFVMYTSDWFGEYVYGGSADPDSPLHSFYSEGT
jgi:hypothetical protein